MVRVGPHQRLMVLECERRCSAAGMESTVDECLDDMCGMPYIHPQGPGISPTTHPNVNQVLSELKQGQGMHHTPGAPVSFWGEKHARRRACTIHTGDNRWKYNTYTVCTVVANLAYLFIMLQGILKATYR